MKVCTIVAANYLPYARVLAASFLDQHPEGHVDVLVVDTVAVDGTEQFSVVRPSELALSEREFHRLAAIYDVTELATALKPWLLELLCARYGEPVTYLDPDIRVYADIGYIPGLAALHSVVLTPHTTSPMPRDGCEPTEVDILISGTYNLGFISVGSGGFEFLRWWQRRLRRDCLHDAPNGLFVDQRWVDLAVHYFDHYVLRDRGCNVAYWNVDQRDLVWVDGEYAVGDEPLRFFHFSGFRPDQPELLSRYHVRRPRNIPAHSAALSRICSDYVSELQSNGFSARGMGTYGYASAVDGTVLTKSIRRRYREALLTTVDDERLPDPFDPADVTRFQHWVRNSTSVMHRIRARLPKSALLALKAARDPQRARVVAAARLRSLMRSYPILAESSPMSADVSGLGVNVVGYFRAEDGVGQGARAMVACLEAADVPYSMVINSHTPSRQHNEVTLKPAISSYPIDLICANADVFPEVVRAARRRSAPPRYTVGVWAWEVEDFPQAMRASAELVDEIWTLSRHSAAAVAPVVDKPVLVFPYPVVQIASSVPLRSDLGLPAGFIFLFCFDVRSGVERKNPVAVTDAFARAFAVGEGPRLVIKAINPESDPSAMSRLRGKMARRPDMQLITHHLCAADQIALMKSCDCYVSLHRAEGLGFTIAEAMACGKPVIATGYSGNLEFMTAGNSYLVPWDYALIPAGCEPYPAGGRWAEPDVTAASTLMRNVFEHAEDAEARGRRAAHDIEQLHRPSARTVFLKSRLAIIRGRMDRTLVP